MPEAVFDAVAAQVEAGEKVTFKVVKEKVRLVSHYQPVAKTIEWLLAVAKFTTLAD